MKAVGLFSVVIGLLFTASLCAAEEPKSFSIPAGPAETTLKTFSEQSGHSVIFATKMVSGVRTNEVKGDYPVADAMDRLLSGTKLSAVPEAQTGGFAIKREASVELAEKNGARAAPNGSDLPKQNANSSATKDEVIELSPFEVVANTTGYYSENTMSGTRLNSPLEDLGAAISVITKQQMEDLAMLDINDVFLYAANTEGTGTFTSVGEDSGGVLTDNNAGDPANANRIRGLDGANVSNGNFGTSNRVPLNPIDVDGIEISRGPNASIFGLGNPSGTVNIIGATANLQRDKSTVSFRADSDSGHSTSLDLNRVLLKNQLAVRFSAVRQRDGFDLKPSGVDSMRYNGMLTFRPFKKTMIRASYQYYHAEGNRPNTFPPRDGISDWRAAGSPTWDPLTSSLKLNGVVLSTNSPSYTSAAAANYGQIYVEPEGITYWGLGYGLTGTNPFGALQANRKLVLTSAQVQDNQPLIGRRTEMITDRDIYDWKSVNIQAPNFFEDKTETSRVTIDQTVFETQRQMLAVQFGWFREDSERYQRYVMSDGGTQGTTGLLSVDINERLLDGTPNPYFLRPLLFQAEPRPRNSPLRNDTYRFQTAYKLDFTKDQGFRRWLGLHSLVGYGEYKNRWEQVYTTRDEISSIQAWTFPNDTANRRANQPVRAIFRFYVGDNQGQNVDYAPAPAPYGTYNFNWGNALTGVFTNEPVSLGELPLAASQTHVIQKTQGALLQSSLLKGRITTTFGRREDRHFTRRYTPSSTQTGLILADRGFAFNYDAFDSFPLQEWQVREGGTVQKGVVVKPFRGWDFVERPAAQGSALTRFAAQALEGLTLRYNESDSFLPAAPARNVFLEYLPDPSGRGKDYGLSLSLFDGKLSLRVNKYETRQINSRNGPSGGLARGALALDYLANAGGIFFSLQEQASDWITAANPTITPEQLNAQLTTLIGVTPQDVEDLRATGQSETDDIVSRGHEVELHFNPVDNWTLTANFTEQQTINTKLGINVGTYIAQRMPYWTTIVDPRIGAPGGITATPGNATARLWWNQLYGGTETPAVLFNRTVGGPLQVAQASEGLARPQIRRYRGSLTSNVFLRGLTSNKVLRGFNVGGSLRYESQGAIGYYGVQQLPAIITDYDINRPIWEQGHVYLDGFIGYGTKLWRNKVRAKFQLNVKNIQEDGRLQPITALPTGEPYQYRIVAPRQFILSATFDL